MKYFVADLHLDGTEKVGLWKKRGFTTDTDHVEYVLDRINSTVPRNAQLFILGDFGKNPGRYRQRIRCRDTWLILGNHDHENQCKRVFGVNKVRLAFATHVRDVNTWLSHYAHAYWPASHYNSFHLYGHTHDQREWTLDRAFGRVFRWFRPKRRSMDCGLDTAKRLLGDFRPFSEDEIYEILAPRPGHDPVTFYKNRRRHAEK